MKKSTTIAALLLGASATAAVAGGLDRSGQNIDVMFEEGTALKFTMGYSMPNVSATPSALTDNIAKDYITYSAGFKYEVNDKLDLGLVFDEPFGANLEYGGLVATPAPGGLGLGTNRATVNSEAVTALARYHFSENISVHGGVRAQRLHGDVQLDPVGGYVLDMESDWAFGYVVGAAYEIPAYAARVALTYNSGFTHTMNGVESFNPAGTYEQDTPQSVNLDFQTGIAANTLLFGSVRWVDWTEFDITPPGYAAATGGQSLVDPHAKDSWTFDLGVGRKFTEKFSASVSFGYERAIGGVASNLGPTDGFWSVGVGGSYDVTESVKLGVGARYVSIGDANGGSLTGNAPFTDNSAWGVGMSLTTSF